MTEPWSSVRNILAIRADSMGDILMTSPALRAIHESAGAKVTLLTSPLGAEAAGLMPFVDNIIIFDAPWVRHSSTGPAELRSLIRTLKASAFEAAIIFTVYQQSALPAALIALEAGIPKRLGYSHENPHSLLTDWIPDAEPVHGIRHETQRQLDLVSSVGFRTQDPGLSINVPPLSDTLTTLLSEPGINPEHPDWIILHPGAREFTRRYPLAGYIETARYLLDAGVRIIVTGSADEQHITQRMKVVLPEVIDLTGKLTFPDLLRLIYISPLVITNNTGISHIASATGTPQVVLYATTNPQHVPWQAVSRVMYFDVPCKACMRGICPVTHESSRRTVLPIEISNAALDILSGNRVNLRKRPIWST